MDGDQDDEARGSLDPGDHEEDRKIEEHYSEGAQEPGAGGEIGGLELISGVREAD